MRKWLAEKLRAWADRLSAAPKPRPFRLDIAPNPDGDGYVIKFRTNSDGVVTFEKIGGGGSVRQLLSGDIWQTVGGLGL